jgi:predicted nucleic acid-binding protein
VISIDASSLAKYILREEGWEKIRKYLEDEPYSLTIALAEVSNAIWKHCMLYKRISLDDARLIFKALLILKDKVVLFEDVQRYLETGFEIATNYGITLYDSLYLAQALKCGSFLTSDRKQWKIARKLNISADLVE